MDALVSSLCLDPSGAGAQTLCLAAAGLLTLLLAGGFALLARADRGRSRAPRPRDLGLPALWRLGRDAPAAATP